MSGADEGTPSLAEQARRLTALQQRILALYDDAEARAIETPKHAAAFRAQAEAEAAPLIAQGAQLRDAIVARAGRRARLAWSVVAAGGVSIAVLAAWLLSRQG